MRALPWLRQAEHDLAIARGHQQRGDFSDACFMAEQSAQKALKAFLIGQGHRSALVHSVAQLTERCAQIDPAFTAHITAGRVLDQYDIPTRYPDALAVPFESYTQEQGTSFAQGAYSCEDFCYHRIWSHLEDIPCPKTHPSNSS